MFFNISKLAVILVKPGDLRVLSSEYSSDFKAPFAGLPSSVSVHRFKSLAARSSLLVPLQLTMGQPRGEGEGRASPSPGLPQREAKLSTGISTQ